MRPKNCCVFFPLDKGVTVIGVTGAITTVVVASLILCYAVRGGAPEDFVGMSTAFFILCLAANVILVIGVCKTSLFLIGSWLFWTLFVLALTLFLLFTLTAELIEAADQNRARAGRLVVSLSFVGLVVLTYMWFVVLSYFIHTKRREKNPPNRETQFVGVTQPDDQPPDVTSAVFQTFS